jgi:hypothetical protein
MSGRRPPVDKSKSLMIRPSNRGSSTLVTPCTRNLNIPSPRDNSFPREQSKSMLTAGRRRSTFGDKLGDNLQESLNKGSFMN